MDCEKYTRLINAAIPPVKYWQMRCFHLTAIVHRRKLLVLARNERKTHPINLLNKKFNREGVDISDEKFTCSELVALNQFKRTTSIDLSKITLINYRVDRNGNRVNSFPCESCRNLLDFLGIKCIYYTTRGGFFEKFTL